MTTKCVIMSSSVQTMFLLLWGKQVELSLCLLEHRVTAAYARNGNIASCVTQREVNGEVYTPAECPLGRSANCEELTNPLTFSGIVHRLLGHPTRSLTL